MQLSGSAGGCSPPPIRNWSKVLLYSHSAEHLLKLQAVVGKLVYVSANPCVGIDHYSMSPLYNYHWQLTDTSDDDVAAGREAGVQIFTSVVVIRDFSDAARDD